MKVALINMRTQDDDCLDASRLFRSTIQSVDDSRLGSFTSTLYESCRDKVVSLRVDNDGNVVSAMAAVHGQLLHLRWNVFEVRARTHFPSVTDPSKSVYGSVQPRGSSSSAF